jgi:hypothetical protein
MAVFYYLAELKVHRWLEYHTLRNKPEGELPSGKQSGGLIGNAPRLKQSDGQKRAPTAKNIASKLTLRSEPGIETLT